MTEDAERLCVAVPEQPTAFSVSAEEMSTTIIFSLLLLHLPHYLSTQLLVPLGAFLVSSYMIQGNEH